MPILLLTLGVLLAGCQINFPKPCNTYNIVTEQDSTYGDVVTTRSVISCTDRG